MRIAVASIITETCSFNLVKRTLQDFKENYFKLGSDVVNVPPKELVVGGFVAAMGPANHRLEGIISTFLGAGGELSGGTLAELKAALLTGIGKAGQLDAVFMADHGAIAAEGELDFEGAILSDLRKRVGKDCFIGVSLDHHANVTQKMVDAADVMLGYETQPHDLPAAGAKAARVMRDIWENKRTPHGAFVKIPMLAPQDHFLTAVGPMKEWFDLAREIEKDRSVIVASTFPSQPWLDVPETGWSSLVYADDAKTARRYAESLAQKAWDLRTEFWRSERLSLPDTVAAANAEPKGIVVISDTGDAQGGGPCDNMSIVAEMLKCGVSGPALIPVVDPAAMEQAVKAGVGRAITLRLGGKRSAAYSPSPEITGVVRAVAEARALDYGDGLMGTAGRSVLLECGNLKIAVLERKDHAINHPSLYQRLGVDVEKAKMVIVKTGSNFQYFRKYQSRLIRADSPGVMQSDLTAFTWKNISHPLYPFDDIKDWRP